MPRLELRSTTGQTPPIDLGLVDIGLSDGDSEPVQLELTNRDTLTLTEIRVSVIGPGAKAVQLARDGDNQPIEWTDGEIIARAGLLPPNVTCTFWCRALASTALDVGDQEFEFVVKSIAQKAEG